MTLPISLRVAPRRQATSGEAESLPHPGFDTDEIPGGHEAERSLDDRRVHRQDLGDPDRARVPEADGAPISERAIPRARAAIESRLASDRTDDQVG